MEKSSPSILIVDDDPVHLTLYNWMMQKEGYKPLTALVESTSVDLPTDKKVDLILLDYRLKSSLTAPQVAKMLQEAFAKAPIIVLSELAWMPSDIREYAVAFVRKGEPAELMHAIQKFTTDPQATHDC
ncbi:MAG TPA: response regulator [Candidatus Angelobacter sp.]|nr:response regulator [Candidatus Angelobacter sp.]